MPAIVCGCSCHANILISGRLEMRAVALDDRLEAAVACHKCAHTHQPAFARHEPDDGPDWGNGADGSSD